MEERPSLLRGSHHTDSWVYTHGSQYPGYKNEIANAGETSSNSNRDKSRLTSFLGRVNYNFDNTYYAGVSYRRDGSSRLSMFPMFGYNVGIRHWRNVRHYYVDPTIQTLLRKYNQRLFFHVVSTHPKE